MLTPIFNPFASLASGASAQALTPLQRSTQALRLATGVAVFALLLRMGFAPGVGLLAQVPVMVGPAAVLFAVALVSAGPWVRTDRRRQAVLWATVGVGSGLLGVGAWLTGQLAMLPTVFVVSTWALALQSIGSQAQSKAPGPRPLHGMPRASWATGAAWAGCVAWWAACVGAAAVGPGAVTGAGPDAVLLIRTTLAASQVLVTVWALMHAWQHGWTEQRARHLASVGFVVITFVTAVFVNLYASWVQSNSAPLTVPPITLAVAFAMIGLGVGLLRHPGRAGWVTASSVVGLVFSFAYLTQAPAMAVVNLTVVALMWVRLLPSSRWPVALVGWAVTLGVYGLHPDVPREAFVVHGLAGSATGVLALALLRAVAWRSMEPTARGHEEAAATRPWPPVGTEAAPFPRSWPWLAGVGAGVLTALSVQVVSSDHALTHPLAHAQLVGLSGLFVGWLAFTAVAFAQRQALQQVVHAQHAQVQAVLDHSHIGFRLFRADGTPVWANAETLRRTGMDTAAFMAHNLFTGGIYDKTGVPDMARAALASGERQESRYQGPVMAGATVDVALRVSRVMWAGEPHVVMQSEDVHELNQWRHTAVTESARAEALTRERQLILESVSVAVAKSKGRRFVWVNPAWTSALGYSPEDMLGQSSVMVHPTAGHAERVHEQVAPALARGEKAQCVTDMLCKDGRLLPVMLTVSMPDPASDEVYFAFMDISEQRDQARRLEAALQAAQAGDAAKSRFLSNISHDLRTPLNGLLGYMQVLASTPLTPAQAEVLGKMGAAGKGLLHLINDVLDYTKMQGDEFALSVEPMRLSPVMREVLDIVQPMALAKGVTLRVEPLPPALANPWWLGDPHRLAQILTNLLSNGIKFTDQGHVTLAASADGEHLRFDVTDTGMGLSPADVGRLFNRFTQLDDSPQRKAQGTGLGLAICKSLAERMGGDVRVTSQLGKGSTFSVRVHFPHALNPVTTAPAPAAPRRVNADATALASVRVLVVDDSAINRDVADSLLTSMGACVRTVSNGLEAVNLLRDPAYEVDVVLMDVHMPVMDGLVATQTIRHDLGLSRLPIVALTAGGSLSDLAEVERVGMNGWVLKPYTPADLLEALRGQVLAYRGQVLGLTTCPAPNAQAAKTPAWHSA